jgi:hypothetical protein
MGVSPPEKVLTSTDLQRDTGIYDAVVVSSSLYNGKGDFTLNE